MADWRRIFLLARFSLRRNRGATLAFALSLGLFQATLIWGYGFIGGGATVRTVVDTLSPELRRALKIVPSLQGGFGPREYVALGLYHPVYLGLGAAYVVSRAADGLAGAVERGTAWLILARPVSRAALVAGEALAIALGAALVVTSGLGGLLLGLATADLGPDLPLVGYAQAAAASWLLFAALGMLALLAAAASFRAGSAAGLGSALALGGFVLDLLPWTGGPPLSLVNPWHWYDPPAIIQRGWSWPAAGMLGAIGLASLAGAVAVWRQAAIGGR
ncbi:MAG TPA: ABC transporter permease subunit [Herpetosiphonaceae bacterium]|nr:ABC transporter permease subunit [Herpetosiphonaceae bacterium]